jgi:hypothetical protein
MIIELQQFCFKDIDNLCIHFLDGMCENLILDTHTMSIQFYP